MNAKNSLSKTVAARLTLADCAGRDTVTVVQAGQILGISKDAAYEAVKRGDERIRQLEEDVHRWNA